MFLFKRNSNGSEVINKVINFKKSIGAIEQKGKSGGPIKKTNGYAVKDYFKNIKHSQAALENLSVCNVRLF